MRKCVLLVNLCWWFCLHAQVPSYIPARGLQGYWPFTGNANDLSGNNHHGQTHGVTLLKDRFGNDNNAYYFNGISNFITTSYEGILGTHPRAISFWALANDRHKHKTIIGWGSNKLFPNAGGRFECAFGGSFYHDVEDPFLGATIAVSDAGVTFEAQEPVTDGNWHHYVFQFNKKYVKDVEVYQDGLLLTHEIYRFYKNCLINTKPGIHVNFGAYFAPEDTIGFYNGLLDDIIIYDRALSKAEINALYSAPDPIKKTNLLKWIPIFLAIILFVIILVWFIRWRVKRLVAAEEEKNKMKNYWYEQENRILKAQMDPHFIFNSLNAIQQFIIVNDNEKAQLYLSKFSRLIRRMLESNLDQNISLKEEIEIIERYLEVESLRFNNIFDYEIIVDKSIDINTTFIPHFLIQPFVENAISHGLLPKIGYKELDIIFERIDEKTLRCVVEDNGIGRKNSVTIKTHGKTKSLGVNFVEQRLMIMSKVENREYYLKITDKENSEGKTIGTKVELQMPIIKI